MKDSLDHLPSRKIRELESITSVIQENCSDLAMIILYGSYARGDWREEKDIPVDATSGSASDYDLLIVTEKAATLKQTSIWQAIDKALFKLKLSAYPQIIELDIKALNQKLRQGRFFFTDIKKDGVLLFDSKKFKLADKKVLSPEEKQDLAQMDFDYWFETATDFFFQFENAMKAEKYSNASFQLHQATEACYKAVLLVFTGYTPKEHYLKELGPKAEKRASLLKNIFPKETKAEQERFKKLDYSYIGGRYDRNFKISKEDLKILSKYTQELITKTEMACKNKIASIMKKLGV